MATSSQVFPQRLGRGVTVGGGLTLSAAGVLSWGDGTRTIVDTNRTKLFGPDASSVYIEVTNSLARMVYGGAYAVRTDSGGITLDATGATVSLYGTVNLNGNMSVLDGINIAFDTSTGTKLGTATGQKIGFWNTAPVAQQTVTGAKGGNAALTSLCAKLALIGLIVDSTS